MNAKGSRCGARYLHELVWERHYGGIAPGFVIQHKNAITMDNRLENLTLVASTRFNPYASQQPNSSQVTTMVAHHRQPLAESSHSQYFPSSSSSSNIGATVGASAPSGSRLPSSVPKQIEHSLYWAAIQQLPPEHLVDDVSMLEKTKFFKAAGSVNTRV